MESRDAGVDDDAEEFEHIPWAHLAARAPRVSPATLYLVAGALLAAALGAVIARAVWPAAPAPTIEAAVPAPTTFPPAPLADDGPVPPATVVSPQLYAEADLMAAVPGDDERRAAALAEWFVADYFTLDRSPGAGERLRAVLPVGSSDVPLPHEGAGGPVSYVEWSRALRVEPLVGRRFRVTVGFRVVAALEEGGYRRLPVRAVEVVLEVDEQERIRLLDLPSPAPSPQPIPGDPWPAGEGPAPPEVVAAALEAAAAWGDRPEVVGSSAAGAGWRVVVTVADTVGVRWPLVVWSDGLRVLPAPFLP